MTFNPHTYSGNWHVVYTRSRAEKKVYADLTAGHIECYLPLQKQLRCFGQRRKWVDAVLITGYCFVRPGRRDYERVLQNSNVVSYVFFNHKAALVPDTQIEAMRQLLRQSAFGVEVSRESFRPGRRVVVMDGPMAGLTGELLDEHGKNRFLVRVDAIHTVFMADIPAKYLTVAPGECFVG